MGIESGITRRDYFAGLAMQKILDAYRNYSESSIKEIAAVAAEQADALIAELDKPKVADEEIRCTSIFFTPKGK